MQEEDPGMAGCMEGAQASMFQMDQMVDEHGATHTLTNTRRL